MSDKIVAGSSELGPRRNGHGRNVMSRWKIKAATAALAALLVAALSLPVYARELQPLAVAAPEQVGMSGERLARITTMLKKEIAEGKLPGRWSWSPARGRSSIRTPSAPKTRAQTR